MKDIKRHRAKLHLEADGKCHYCGCQTVLPSQAANGQSNLATIDHVYSRFHPRRAVHILPNERRHVLSCFRCNQQRARLEEIVQFLVDDTFYIVQLDGKVEQRKTSEMEN